MIRARASSADEVLGALPGEVAHEAPDREQLLTDGQTRRWWGTTPIDLFLNTTPFHRDVGQRVCWESFGGTDVPFLACRDLAVFKAFFDRTRDWGDLEEMSTAGILDVDAVIGVLACYLGGDDARIEKLRSLI